MIIHVEIEDRDLTQAERAELERALYEIGKEPKKFLGGRTITPSEPELEFEVPDVDIYEYYQQLKKRPPTVYPVLSPLEALEGVRRSGFLDNIEEVKRQLQADRDAWDR